MIIASVLVANERIKSVSTLFFNLGGALFAATAAKFYTDPEMDLALVLWLSGAAFIIYIAWLILSLLELETTE